MKHIEVVQQTIKQQAKLCIVSKRQLNQDILHYYNLGYRIFAENKAQELLKKVEQLPKDIEWHFIGHLQTNKVKQILPYVSCIQSLDSLKLASVIDHCAKQINKTIPCFLEVHLATQDENKSGLPLEEVDSFLEQIGQYKNIDLCGMMVMGPHTDNKEQQAYVFAKAQALFKQKQLQYPNLRVLSMGMSDDYKVAQAYGSSMVRIGTYLFQKGGEKNEIL